MSLYVRAALTNNGTIDRIAFEQLSGFARQLLFKRYGRMFPSCLWKHSYGRDSRLLITERGWIDEEGFVSAG